jgi:succinate dehydrogenase / fumarate reductase, cytochrome b subunit
MQNAIKNPRKASNFLQWFDLRRASLGTFAFIMNRVAGIGLVVYLFLHLVMLSQLARGAGVYDQFLALVKNPLFVAGEYLVVAAVLLHGLNGIRVALTSLGIAVPAQKRLFMGLMAIAVVGLIVFGIKMFGGE